MSHPLQQQGDWRRRRAVHASRNNNSWSSWAPLVMTASVAAVGVAAWIWHERQQDDEREGDSGGGGSGYGAGPDYGPAPGASRPPNGYETPGYPMGPAPYGSSQDAFLGGAAADYGQPPPGSAMGPHSNAFDARSGVGPMASDDTTTRSVDNQGFVTRMSGALRRTPSPQQILDGASKRVAAGVAAAGAAMGDALASIREEDRKDYYEDHSRWSEEQIHQSNVKADDVVAEPRRKTSRKGSKSSKQRSKTVAIVVSAETTYEHDMSAEYHHEEASLLSHLSDQMTESNTRLYIYICNPNYQPEKQQEEEASSASFSAADKNATSMTSSFSNIAAEEGQSTATDSSPIPQSTNISASRTDQYQRLYSQAKALVSDESMVVPFTTPNEYIRQLRHLKADTVYVQAALLGKDGEHVDPIKRSVGQIIVVVGDESGHGGLVDSEDEHGPDKAHRWWLDDDRIGLGKSVEVVESLRLREDFKRRIHGT